MQYKKIQISSNNNINLIIYHDIYWINGKKHITYTLDVFKTKEKNYEVSRISCQTEKNHRFYYKSN